MLPLSYDICHYPEISHCTSYCGVMVTSLFLSHPITHIYTWQPVLAWSRRQERYFSISTKNDDCFRVSTALIQDCADSGWYLAASLAGVRAKKCCSSKFFVSDKLPRFVFPTRFCGPGLKQMLHFRAPVWDESQEEQNCASLLFIYLLSVPYRSLAKALLQIKCGEVNKARCFPQSFFGLIWYFLLKDHNRENCTG